MDYKDWESTYKKIVSDCHFSTEADEKAADVLNNLVKKKRLISVKKLDGLLNDKEVFVFGAGHSLDSSLIIHKKRLINKVKISADGATSALLKHAIYPDVIVTDLDGNISDQIKANKNGSITIIHAHGDNIDALKTHLPKFNGYLAGTTQINPEYYDNLHNFGGFTDGDRGIFLADHFHAKRIYLIGFDFNNEVGEYSFAKNKDKILKLKKLKWCKHLIEILKKNNHNIYYL